jgi:hypothetical protein
MNPARTCTVPPAAHAELTAYLRHSGSTFSTEEAVVHAIKSWIAQGHTAAAPMQGYQWKQLFLPAGARVRMRYDDDWRWAEVIGDELIYRRRALSPHQMVQEVAGDGRNAWRDLWIRLPGEKTWTSAAVLRANQVQQAAKQPLSAADAMTSAAKAMGDALKTALVLIEHANNQAQNTLERRLPKYRRECDMLSDIH